VSIDPKAVETWPPEKLFTEYVQRHNLLGQLVGNLYPAVVGDEMCVIEQACMNRYGCGPGWLIDWHHITASRTDEFGVVHDVIKPCIVHFRGMRMTTLFDVPAKPVTCLLCLGG
jgi:hypothetical protein